ncbi:MAG: hypothetical protein JEZ03_17285 [Bacteroidales bacterium]|nr:hypothetical protein [Bacteroidales bacterium]
MKAVRILLLALLFVSFLSVKASEYPWEKYGFKFKVVTLSNGKYQEFHDLEDVIEIGSVLYNTQTKQIVGFVQTDTLYSESSLTPHIVSRWISPDPLTEEYPSWSPYNYTMNNPIMYIDPDGQVVVDANGNEVVVEQNKDGNYTGNYTFAEGTSQEVQDQFMANGGTLLSEMMTIETGTEYVTAAVQSEENIHYTISEAAPKSSSGSGNRRLAGTKDVKGADGSIEKTQVTIYKGSIEQSMESGNLDSRLSVEQNMAARAVHETHHATNKDDIKVRREQGPGKLSKSQHQNAYNAGNNATFEFQLLEGIIK